ncbi:hypothetical protein C8F04DRAFT_1036144 [Mycena alexandri]|uniref:Uncharacterized protein n=1 Tax=Mycena alexandri TaxID=1745969 RepID=A0AAD6X2V1_9AGAR|nr:hypothetical protein C8F04DRAFT_1036144 [Mycena alexandri]
MYLEPCSQEMTAALEEMEQPAFVPTQVTTLNILPGNKASPEISELATVRCSSPESNECSTIAPSTPMNVRVKTEPSSPTTAFSPLKVSEIKFTSTRKRQRSASDSDDSDSDDEVEVKKHKPCAQPTHLSQFFSAYTKFEYDPSGPASQQFQQLRSVYPRSERKALAEGYNRALGLTFSQEYGDDVDNLENWQRLCRVVEIPVPDSLEECKYAIEDAHVNLVDLLDIVTTGEAVHRFETERALSVYTLTTGKIFPRSQLHKGALLKYLLRRIFRPPPEDVKRRNGLWIDRRL